MTNKDINEYIATQLGLNQYTMVDDFSIKQNIQTHLWVKLYMVKA